MSAEGATGVLSLTGDVIAVGGVGLISKAAPFSGRIASSRRFGRERREFAGGRRSDRTLPRSFCLARYSRCGGAALPRRYVSRRGQRGGLYVFEPPAGGHRYTSRGAGRKVPW